MTTEMKKRIEEASLPVTSTIREAMQTIDRGAMGVALLVEPVTNRFKGLITDGDVRRALLKGLGLESSVSDIPRPRTKTARVGDSAGKIAALFSDPVRIIPILDDDDRVVDLVMYDKRMYLSVAEPLLGEKELQYVSECVLTGWISSAGGFVARFEEALADFCGTGYSIATSSGTAALHLALLALDIGPGDEVIVPTLTFIATANAVTYTGAKCVFVDSEPGTWTIDPNKIEEVVTPRTKAIIPVHIYGHPADMDPILKIASRHNLFVVEDAAEAHGARYKGKPVGSIGDVGIFSFYGNKIITTGEGGMIVTDKPELADRMYMLRDHGMSKEKRYWHLVIGYNYRLTNLQAAIGVAQMEKVDRILKSKHLISEMYNEGLQKISGVVLPPKSPWASSVCWLYTILINEQEFGASRDEVMAELKSRGIETRPMFTPVHLQPVYDTHQSFPVSEQLAGSGLSLPSAVGLRGEEIHYVIDVIADVKSSLTRKQKLNG